LDIIGLRVKKTLTFIILKQRRNKMKTLELKRRELQGIMFDLKREDGSHDELLNKYRGEIRLISMQIEDDAVERSNVQCVKLLSTTMDGSTFKVIFEDGTSEFVVRYKNHINKPMFSKLFDKGYLLVDINAISILTRRQTQ
jgi:hypothetical protein